MDHVSKPLSGLLLPSRSDVAVSRHCLPLQLRIAIRPSCLLMPIEHDAVPATSSLNRQNKFKTKNKPKSVKRHRHVHCSPDARERDRKIETI